MARMSLLRGGLTGGRNNFILLEKMGAVAMGQGCRRGYNGGEDGVMVAGSRGESLNAIGGRLASRQSSIYFCGSAMFVDSSCQRRRASRALTLAEREVISRFVNERHINRRDR